MNLWLVFNQIELRGMKENNYKIHNNHINNLNKINNFYNNNLNNKDKFKKREYKMSD
jgi:hypothetical protein